MSSLKRRSLFAFAFGLFWSGVEEHLDVVTRHRAWPREARDAYDLLTWNRAFASDAVT